MNRKIDLCLQLKVYFASFLFDLFVIEIPNSCAQKLNSMSINFVTIGGMFATRLLIL